MSRRRSSKRGSAAIAILVVLAMLQIIVGAMVLSSSRGDEMMTLRIDSARALYAAEAGTNMALREVMLNVDEDGDGGIGSVSNDGNDSNDPALGPARLVAAATEAGGDTIITVSGRAGEAARRVELVVGP